MQDEELGSMWVDHLLTITNHMMKLGHQVEHLQMCYHQTPIMILIAHCNHLQDLKASILISTVQNQTENVGNLYQFLTSGPISKSNTSINVIKYDFTRQVFF